MLASAYVPILYPEFVGELGVLSYFMFAILGVFVFEVVLANTDIIFFNNSVGIIQMWATRARDPAVAAATEKLAQLDKELQQRIAQGLEGLSEPDLNAHLLNIVGRDELRKLEKDAAAENASPKLYKALELANKAPSEAEAILKQAKRSRNRQ